MSIWSSFIYQYAVGGFFFFLALFLGIRKGVLKMDRRGDRITLAVLIGGLLFYFCFHGLWMLWASR